MRQTHSQPQGLGTREGQAAAHALAQGCPVKTLKWDMFCNVLWRLWVRNGDIFRVCKPL